MTTSGILQIAIDGPAGAGKSTVARKLADKLGFLYLDTGAMYRASTWLALKNGLSLNDGPGIAKLATECDILLKPADETSDGKIRVFVDGEDITFAIRTNKMSEQVALVAALAEVREVLVAKQRELAKLQSSVIDGRDIGTVVMPKAGLKIFLTASAEERARRRLKELNAQGEETDFQALLTAINERDYLDSNREVSPLTKAVDAIEVITDNMNIAEVVLKLEELAQEALKRTAGI
jgi:cytidylate kinase